MFIFDEARVLVTGAAGFIGSHVTERLLQVGAKVRGIDNFVTGDRKNVERMRGQPNFEFIEGDLLNQDFTDRIVRGVDAVFHLAVTRPEYGKSFLDAMEGYKNDVLGTYNLLRSIGKSGNGKKIVYTSSGLVYGETETVPTSETYGPLRPSSAYGASKLASEAFISVFCHAFDMQAALCRLANVEGLRKPYGVIYDFVNKLKQSSTSLEILGDPGDRRAYLHVSDCAEALLFCLSHLNTEVECWNVGPVDSMSVKELATIVIDQMGLGDIPIVEKHHSEEHKIKGSVRESRPSIDKIIRDGWHPKHNSKQAVTLAAAELASELCQK